ncbi:uncharacterized protein LOC121866488 [Homarus americanus]|uniref:uncharacterized protein LOC121866488 n=1 Tax=Homarus americanus TaxID=6706 RepID=UPI001C446BCD|nr:uncharacterized protein LOC121866488 [Homarus americanus]
MSATSVPPPDLLWFRYFHALKTYGRDALCAVFQLSYQGGYPIKTYLIDILGYSNTQLRKNFDIHQRVKLESSIPDINKFDITLLYSLLQKVCGFANINDTKWTTPPSDGTSLEYNLFRIKKLRNEISHENEHFTQHILDIKLTHLQQLIEDTFQEAYTVFKQSSQLEVKLSVVKNYFDGLRTKIREPADLKEIQKEMEVYRREIELEIKENSWDELCTQFSVTCQVDPVPWLHLGVEIKPSVLFTEPTLVEDEVMCARPHQTQQVRVVKCNEVISFKCRDGSSPDVLLLTGEGGIGKTTFLKFVVETWTEEPKVMQSLDKVEVLLYSQCRGSNIQTFDQLLQDLLHETYLRSGVSFEFFKEIIKANKILIIVDGFDEYNEASFKLVKDIVSMASNNMQVLLTTRPGSADQLTALIPQGKRILHLVLKGIPQSLHFNFVENMINTLVSEVNQRYSIKTKLNDKLYQLREHLGDHLNNPLTLTILTLLWVDCPDKLNTLTTSTDLYYEIGELLTSKLVDRLMARGVCNPKEKCNSFLIFYDYMALQCIQRREYELQENTINFLKQKCDELHLPHEDVLSTYFGRKRTRQGLIPRWIWSFLHLRFQEYSVSRSVVRRLLSETNLVSSAASMSHDADPSIVSKSPSADYSITSTGHDATMVVNNVIKKVLSPGCKGEKSAWVQGNSTFQSVLFNMTGLLARIGQHQLNRYAHDIVQLIGDDNPLFRLTGKINIDNYLHHVVESKMNGEMIKEVVTVLADFSTWSTHGSYICGLSSVLAFQMPQTIEITIKNDPALSPGLDDTLVALSHQKISVKLHIQYHFNDSGCSDNFLHAIRHGGKCTMEEFHGQLSEDKMVLLPSTLWDLRLRGTTEQLPALTATLPRIKGLRAFCNYDPFVSFSCILDP